MGGPVGYFNMVANGVTATGLARGPNKGHVTEPLAKRTRQSDKKGQCGTKVKLARSVIRDVVGFAPYDVAPWSFCLKASTSVHSSTARRGLEPTVVARRSALREGVLQAQKMKK